MKRNVNSLAKNNLHHFLPGNQITGIKMIDAQIIQFNPFIIRKSIREIQIMTDAIIALWFGDAASIATDIIDNENIIEYLYGIKAIIKYEKITDIDGLQDYIRDRIDLFDPKKICGNI